MRNNQQAWRTTSYRILVAVFVLGVIASTIAIWADIRVHESDAWASTVRPLANDPAVQAFVIQQTVSLLETQITLDAAAGELESFSRDQLLYLAEIAMGEFVASPTFSHWWTEANRIAHQIVMQTLVTDPQGANLLQTWGGDLVLNLEPALAWVNSQIETIVPDAGYTIEIPPDQLVNVVYSSDTLESITSAIEILDNLALWLPMITLLAFIGALLVGPRFSEAVIHMTLALATSMLLLLVVINFGRWWLVMQQPLSHRDLLDALIKVALNNLLSGFRLIAILALLSAGVLMLPRSRYANHPRVKAFLAEHQEAIIGAAIAVATTLLIISNYPPLWVSIVAIGMIVLGTLHLIHIRRSSDMPSIQNQPMVDA